MSDLFARKAEELGLNDPAIRSITIDTGDTPGPTYLSNNLQKSAIAPLTARVNTVDEMKELAGIPNARAKQRTEDFFPVPPKWQAEKNRLAHAELSLEEKKAVCEAYSVYVYDDSHKVKSYKEIINKHFFPMDVTVFAAGDVTVRAGHPLIITSDSLTDFNHIMMEPGAQIIRQAAVHMRATKLTKTGTGTRPLELISDANDGKDGTDGGQGGEGDRGQQGAAGSSGKNSCDRQPGKGGTGETGRTGRNGGVGGNGAHGSPVTEKYEEIDAPEVILLSTGGDGGRGGRGGQGGKGGQGGPGGPKTGHCNEGEQGDGGRGGEGGPGGQGGRGGNGGPVSLDYERLIQKTKFTLGKPRGRGGLGGPGGSGGSGGDGYRTGPRGNDGPVGQNGENGQPGKVEVKGNQISS